MSQVGMDPPGSLIFYFFFGGRGLGNKYMYTFRNLEKNKCAVQERIKTVS